MLRDELFDLLGVQLLGRQLTQVAERDDGGEEGARAARLRFLEYARVQSAERCLSLVRARPARGENANGVLGLLALASDAHVLQFGRVKTCDAIELVGKAGGRRRRAYDRRVVARYELEHAAHDVVLARVDQREETLVADRRDKAVRRVYA